MSDSPDATNPVNGSRPQEASLREAITERDRLRQELTQAQEQVFQLRCQAEMLRQEWFNAKLQEEEYRRYITKLTGIDPSISPGVLLETRKNGVTMQQIIGEIEQEAGLSSAGEQHG